MGTLIVVAAPPSGDAGPLALAAGRHHPDVAVDTIDGNPLSGPAAADAAGWERTAVALPPARWALLRGLVGARHRLDQDADLDEVLVLVAGGVAVLGPLDALWATPGDLVAVSRSAAPPPNDGFSPRLVDLVADGTASSAAVLVRRPGGDLLDRLIRVLATEPAVPPGRALELATREGASLAEHPSLGVGRWRAPTGPVALLDVDGVDPDEPWDLSLDDAPPRVRLSEHPSLAAAYGEASATGQMAAGPPPLALPAAVEVDAAMRRVVADSIERHLSAGGPLCPPPFTATAELLRWLGTDADGTGGPGRYWRALYAERDDLREMFPEVAGGRYARFNRWAARRWRVEGASLLLPTPHDDGYEIVDADRSPLGVNVIGYLDRASGLGEVARQVADALEAAGLPVARVALGRTPSPLLPAPERPRLDQELRYDTSIVVGTAEEVSALPEQLPNGALTDRRTIGYWFWELAEPSPKARTTVGTIDEVWTATTFVHDAFASHLPQPVHVAPLPRPAPQPSSRTRRQFDLPDDRFVALCSFSLYSVAERKNPLGAIEAFTRAFAPDEGPLLVIRTMNGDRRWPELERIRLAASGRPDIRVWDETLDPGDHFALVREVDCLLSLHRSEGLGLHLLEAMALGTPVVATDWSGPADFLDPTNAELVPCHLVPVTRGEGAYATSQVWAEPDLDVAAAALRRLADQPDHGAALAERARRTIHSLPDHAAAGRAMRSLLGR